MRTIRLALVLLALAVFIGAIVGTASAATASPSAISTPVKKTVTPTKAPVPTKMSAPKMMAGLEKFSKANELAGNAVKLEAAQMTNSIGRNIASSSGKTSTKLSLSGMRGMPQLGMGKLLSGYSMNMPAMATMNMPDWTAPGIILTI